jgi:hypothetical protein
VRSSLIDEQDDYLAAIEETIVNAVYHQQFPPKKSKKTKNIKSREKQSGTNHPIAKNDIFKIKINNKFQYAKNKNCLNMDKNNNIKMYLIELL